MNKVAFFIAFNRTRMELKHISLDSGRVVISAFNRTRMELKLNKEDISLTRVIPFNRTRMELKLYIWKWQ